MKDKQRPLTEDQLKLALLDALEFLNSTAYYEDGYSEEDKECYLMLKHFIQNCFIQRLRN